MATTTRVLATLTFAALVAAGASGCASGGDDTAAGQTSSPGGTSAAESSEGETSEGETAGSETATTTSSTPVPGPADTSVDVPGPVAERWDALGGVESDLGRATGPAEEVAGGSITTFERGAIVLTPEGGAFVVQGEILVAYLDAGGPEGELGFPVSDETTTDGGWVSAFEHGAITYLDGVAEVELN
ncbi:hypothetical protein NCCP2495_18600 [Dietzia sp. NCCP-2495]|uniref:LGFP repeat-containing protein n=1 Tax=Dietzia sp. NCCP-2495 TaxID=2934675 RepID=UPI00222E42DB|nr:hypothetical protein [Dietzia sp. NCCP-2495]GLB63981.1 hypothetical protein NCCP2495_18600 [Dietzia sp. NCCP-2495]